MRDLLEPVARWLELASRHAASFQERQMPCVEAVELQLDELFKPSWGGQKTR